MTTQQTPTIPLPKAWNQHVRSAVLHVVALAQYATAYTRGWAVDSINPRVRQQAELDRLQRELALVNEQLRIVTARINSIPARSRPHYRSTERMAILELKTARGWSLRQTADKFLVTPATIASWLNRSCEQDDSLVQSRSTSFPSSLATVSSGSKRSAPRWAKSRLQKHFAARVCTLVRPPWEGYSRRIQ